MNTFERCCQKAFDYQIRHNEVYKAYVEAIGIRPAAYVLRSLEDIPFLPIEFFKSHKVYAAETEPRLIFHSSATASMRHSSHYVAYSRIYEKSLSKAFRLFYGKSSDYCILGLLPHYLERPGSSLVYMVQYLMKESGHPSCGFFLYDYPALAARLRTLAARGQKTLLIGLSAALLDMAGQYRIDFPSLTIIETGGMKKQGKELSREALHTGIAQGFPSSAIASEYGMAELLSQAYTRGEGALFFTPPWMRVLVRDSQDPFVFLPAGEAGGLNIIDLANMYSCPFIETRDLGRLHESGGFEVLGRMDKAERRGCNILLE